MALPVMTSGAVARRRSRTACRQAPSVAFPQHGHWVCHGKSLRISTGVGRAVAAGDLRIPSWRKVRAPQDTVVGNAHRPRGSGKCHREQTADGRLSSSQQSDSSLLGRPPAQVRVKRCGKSAPRVLVTGPARQTPPGARPSRREELSVPLDLRVGRAEAASNRRPREMTVLDKTRLTGPLLGNDIAN